MEYGDSLHTNESLFGQNIPDNPLNEETSKEEADHSSPPTEEHQAEATSPAIVISVIIVVWL